MTPFFVICENGLNRDEQALRHLLGRRDLRVTPRKGETLDDRSARLVEREFERRGEKLVLVMHRDADGLTWKNRKQLVEQWFKASRLDRFASQLVVCTPEPCIERWLCLGAGLSHRSRQTQRPCDPWKKAWEKPSKPEHHRLPLALERLRLKPPPDLADFLLQLDAAGD